MRSMTRICEVCLGPFPLRNSSDHRLLCSPECRATRAKEVRHSGAKPMLGKVGTRARLRGVFAFGDLP